MLRTGVCTRKKTIAQLNSAGTFTAAFQLTLNRTVGSALASAAQFHGSDKVCNAMGRGVQSGVYTLIFELVRLQSTVYV